MIEKPTYEELEERVKEFEKEAEKRKQIEEALAFEREQLFAIFDSMVDGVYVSDIETHEILYVNQASRVAFQKELIGGICYKEFQGLDSPCEFCTNEIILKQKPEPHRWEYHNPVLDRDYAFVDRIIKWPDGRDVRLEIALDITDRKRAEEALRESERFLSAIFNSIQDGISVLDKDLKIIRVNRTMQELYAHMLPLEGKRCFEAYHKRTGACEICPSLRALESGKLEMDEIPLTQAEGVTGTLEVYAFPMLDVSGKPTGIVEYVRDITERKRTHEILRQTEKMLSVGGLAAGMAHEINNPLAGIMQNIQVMKNRMSGELTKNIAAAEECGTSIETIETYMEKRGMFETINLVMESGKRAAKIVDNMLSFSRKSDDSLAPHFLCDLLDQTVELAENDYNLKKKYDFREIEIVREYEQAMPQVTCEGSKIQQVFLNILKNGAQAMAGSKDDKNTPLFILRVMQEGDMARVEIEDNGPGMGEATCKRVFDPFYTTKPVGSGTGLGMSVSYFIITENHGGTMEVESAPGKGAKFIIRLPFEDSFKGVKYA